MLNTGLKHLTLAIQNKGLFILHISSTNCLVKLNIYGGINTIYRKVLYQLADVCE